MSAEPAKDIREGVTLSLVIPAFNEAGGIGETIVRVEGILARITDRYEMVVVDDGSTDRTWEEVELHTLRNSRIKLIRFTRNFGKEAAISAGLEYSKGRAVVVMDGDLQHPPELIGKMFELWEKDGFQVVHAVKERRQNEPIGRRMFSTLFYWIMRAFSGYELDMASDFKLLDRTAVEGYLSLPEKLKFFRGLIPWFGFRSASVSFTPGTGSRPNSQWKFLGLVRMGARAICTFSALPMQIVTILGGVVFMASFILGLDTLYMKLSGKAEAGFATVIFLLLFIGSILMFSLGLIGQYLGMIYEEIKRRPVFIIEKARNI